MLRSLPRLLVLGSAILVGGLGSALAQSPGGEGVERPRKTRNPVVKPRQEREVKEGPEGYKQMSDVAPLLTYRIKFVDIPLVAEEMQLDKGQQEILEQIVVDYMEQLDQQRLELLDRMIRSTEASRKDDPSWEVRQKQRAAVSSRNGRKFRAQKASNMRASMRGELAASEGTDPLVSNRSAMLNAWASMHQEEWETLMGSIDVIRNPDQPGHWEAIIRSLRRRNSPWNANVYGEGVNLGQIIMSDWGRDNQIIPGISDVLTQYTIEYDDAMAHRDGVMVQTHPVILDAKVYHHPGPWLRSIQKQVDARVAMARVNEMYIDLIASDMPEQDAERFRQLAWKKMYPDIYMTNQFEHLVEHLRSYSKTYGLTEDQLLKIDTIEDQYYNELGPLRERRVEVVRVADPRRLMNRAESEAMMKCYGLMDSLNLEEDKILIERNELKQQYLDMDKEYLGQIKDVISEEFFETLPAVAYRPGRGDMSRSPVKDSNPDAPVVYLKGPGDGGRAVTGRASSENNP